MVRDQGKKHGCAPIGELRLKVSMLKGLLRYIVLTVSGKNELEVVENGELLQEDNVVQEVVTSWIDLND